MNVTEVIDEVLERTDNVRGAPADYADRRKRILGYVIDTVDEVWWLRDWSWRMVRATVTVPAGLGCCPVPADFNDWGHDGTIYGLDGEPLEPTTERGIQGLREKNLRTDTPGCYALFGVEALTFLKLIQFPYNESALVLPIWYMSKPPALDEGANVENLSRVPVQYHRTIILPGVRYRSEEAKSDARSVKTEAKYEAAKKRVLETEARGRNKIVRLPSFFAR